MIQQYLIMVMAKETKCQSLCLQVQCHKSSNQNLQELHIDYWIIGKNKVSDIGITNSCSK